MMVELGALHRLTDAPGMTADLPFTLIEPSRGWVALQLRELWRYRELFIFLTWRGVKVRYKQASLGVAWAVLQPLLRCDFSA